MENQTEAAAAERQPQQNPQPQQPLKTKFCKHCGAQIPEDAVLCTACGRQVEELKGAAAQPSIIINNENTNLNQNTLGAAQAGRRRSKWVALALCFFLGVIRAHKFYEGRTGMGVLYLFTLGLFGIGVLIDFIALLFKPNPYYV